MDVVLVAVRRECDGYSSTIAAWLRREGETLYFHGIVRFESGKYRRIEMLRNEP